tara:strand:- start:1085 stop:1342 length:258 start_codon:yes stop_codon:yes gene_type:complete
MPQHNQEYINSLSSEDKKRYYKIAMEVAREKIKRKQREKDGRKWLYCQNKTNQVVIMNGAQRLWMQDMKSLIKKAVEGCVDVYDI